MNIKKKNHNCIHSYYAMREGHFKSQSHYIADSNLHRDE